MANHSLRKYLIVVFMPLSAALYGASRFDDKRVIALLCRHEGHRLSLILVAKKICHVTSSPSPHFRLTKFDALSTTTQDIDVAFFCDI